MAGQPSEPAVPIDPGLAPLVDLAIADLVDRLGVSADEVSLVSATLTSWGDNGFLGGPMAELRHLTVPIDGSEIVLSCDHQARMRSYRYRTGGDLVRPTLHLDDRPQDPTD